MAVREFKGPRLLPTGYYPYDHDSTKAYEQLEFVINANGDTFLSMKPVPPGTDLPEPPANNEYWLFWNKWSPQIEEYARQVQQYDQRITDNATAIAGNVTAIEEEAIAREEADNAINEKIELIDKQQLPTLPVHYVVAHRGFSAAAPENTMAAFTLAGEARAHVCESDLRFTSDGIAVCMHNASVDSMTDGSGQVSNLTYAQISSLKIDAGNGIEEYPDERVPLFRDFISVCAQYNMTALIDIKVQLTPENIDTLMRDIKPYIGHCIFSSGIEASLDALKNYDPSFMVTYIADLTQANINKCVSKGYDGISFEFSTYDGTLIRKAYEAGLHLVVWTHAIPANWNTTNWKYVNGVVVNNPFNNVSDGASGNYYTLTLPGTLCNNNKTPAVYKTSNILAPRWCKDSVAFTDIGYYTDQSYRFYERQNNICVYLGEMASLDIMVMNTRNKGFDEDRVFLSAPQSLNQDLENTGSYNIAAIPSLYSEYFQMGKDFDGNNLTNKTAKIVLAVNRASDSPVKQTTPTRIENYRNLFRSYNQCRDSDKKLMIGANDYKPIVKEVAPYPVYPIVNIGLYKTLNKSNITVSCDIPTNCEVEYTIRTYNYVNGKLNLIHEYGWSSTGIFNFEHGEGNNDNAVVAASVTYKRDRIWNNYRNGASDAAINSLYRLTNCQAVLS